MSSERAGGFKRINTRLEEIPGLTCDIHGEYTGRRVWIAGMANTWTHCPTCAEEENASAAREEQERRQAELIAGLIKRLAIPPRFQGKTLDNFVADTPAQRSSLEIVRKYVAEFQENRELGRSLLFIGEPGTGKTHLACGILDALARRCRSGLYITVADLIRRLRATWNRDRSASETEGEIIKKLEGLDLLVVDEIGVQYGADAEKVQLFDVLNSRYNAMRPTLLLSNLDLKGVTEYLGERVVDRMREGDGRMIVFSGESYRVKANRLQDAPKVTELTQ